MGNGAGTLEGRERLRERERGEREKSVWGEGGWDGGGERERVSEGGGERESCIRNHIQTAGAGRPSLYTHTLSLSLYTHNRVITEVSITSGSRFFKGKSATGAVTVPGVVTELTLV